MAQQQPKETDVIKRKLESFAALQRKIDNQIERLEQLKQTMSSPSSPNLGSSGGGSYDGVSKIQRQVEKKDELDRKIRELVVKESEIRKELEQLIEQLEKPDEQTVLEMRYLDRQNWWAICVALYGNRDDYQNNGEKYLKRTFKLHGSALQSLARAYNAIN